MSVIVVVGGGFGSESKGRVAADLHRARTIAAGVRVGGPNAGHTVCGDDGTAHALRQLPVAAVADPRAQLIIAAGSEIELDVLAAEIRLLEGHGYHVAERLLVDPQATIISPHHKTAELYLEHGTTGKGIGAARADRLLRRATLAKDWTHRQLTSDVALGDILARMPTAGTINDLASRGDVLIEGTQGYGLGLHAGFYPHCTSGDCRAIDFMAQAGVSPFAEVEVWLVVRERTPSVSAGNSGPLKDETSWEQIGVPAEFTTVTKKMRRVGEWDAELVREAVQANGGANVKVALAFADYWWPEIKGMSGAGLTGAAAMVVGVAAELLQIEAEIGAPVCQIGTGPDTSVWL